MLGGAYPFDTRLGPIDKLIKQASFHFNHPRFQSISNNAKHLIKGLLTVDPKKRFSIKQVFQHPWIESFHFFKNINPSVIPAQPNVSHSLHSENTSSTPLLPSFSKYSSSVPLFNVKAPIEDIFKKKHSSCSIDVTKSKPLNYTTSNQSLHSHSNLSIPSPSISDPHDLSNLKIHDAQNDLFSKPLLNERSEPRDIILSPKASFSSLSSNRILLPAQSTPALYDTTRHDTYRELYPFAEPKTIADKKYRKVQNVDNSNYTTNSQHSEKVKVVN
jgi:serine/threonine protein kinase